jgi:glycosyltransferase AglD
MKKPYFSLVLALYNEGSVFQTDVERIVKELKKIKKPWEIIFVEDKSNDDTKKTLKKLLPKIPNAKAIYHTQNQGRGKTVTDGILETRGDVVGFLDVDLEVAETYIPLFIKEIEHGVDMAVGRRFYENSLHSLTRVITSRGYSLIVKTLLHIPIKDTETGYKFFKREKILAILPQIEDKGWFWDTEICARAVYAGLKVTEIPVLFIRREDKKSTVRIIPDTWDYFVKVIRFTLKNATT